MRDRALSLMLAILALMLFVGLFFEPKPQLSNSMASTEDQGDQGLAAFYSWLKERDLPVQSWRERWFELLERHQSGHVLVAHYPFRMQAEKTGNWSDASHAYVNVQEQQEMLRWIAAGNTLVLALGAMDAEGQSPEIRAASRQELSYLDLFNRIGWQISGAAAGVAEVESAQAEEAEADSSATAESDAEPADAAPSDVSTDAALAFDAVNARPQALHKLAMQLTPGAKPLLFDAKSWEAQGKLAMEFSPLDSTECSAKALKADESNSEDDRAPEDGDEKNAASSEPARSEAVETASVDYTQDRIDARGNTVNAAAPETLLCTPLGLQKAYVILRSARDQSPAAWWLGGLGLWQRLEKPEFGTGRQCFGSGSFAAPFCQAGWANFVR
jgi:hypothetical protein